MEGGHFSSTAERFSYRAPGGKWRNEGSTSWGAFDSCEESDEDRLPNGGENRHGSQFPFLDENDITEREILGENGGLGGGSVGEDHTQNKFPILNEMSMEKERSYEEDYVFKNVA